MAQKLTSEERKNNKIRAKALQNQRVRIYNSMVEYQKMHSKERKHAPTSSFISLQHINKIYDNKVQAVYDFNLEIKPHEFIVLVGPSGCGKSTTLRMIAGLEKITAGDLYIDGTYANELEPKNRDIAMVFQSYALYPHMSVKGNMSFGLRIRKVPTQQFDKNGEPLLAINKGLIGDYTRERKNLVSLIEELKQKGEENSDWMKQITADLQDLDEKIQYLKETPVHVYRNKHIPKEQIDERVDNAAEILQIKDYLDRRPKALSGGQCQRVALGRAIVRNAKVFLMDEPLSNLDAKLRVQMRSEIINLHNQLNATTIYVTHDQTEAMTMATRIVVMSKGYVQQVGTPREIYDHPSNLFVATFIGSPSMNLYDGTAKDGKITLKNNDVIDMGSDVKAKIEEFYVNELASYKAEQDKLLENFVERNALIEKLKVLEAKEQTPKVESEIKSLKEDMVAVEESNERLVFLRKAISKYEEFISNKTYDVVFGIRPENIHNNEIEVKKDNTYKLDLKVNVAELLGHEYFIHTNYNDKDLVSKIRSSQIISTGDSITLYLNLDMAHIFDSVSTKIIK